MYKITNKNILKNYKYEKNPQLQVKNVNNNVTKMNRCKKKKNQQNFTKCKDKV